MSDVVKVRDLEECEAEIEKATVFIRGGWYLAGRAVGKIIENELWTQAQTFYGTKQAYFKDRWGWAARTAEQLYQDSRYVDTLRESSRNVLTGYPQAVAHPLVSFKNEANKAERVVKEAVKVSEREGSVITAPLIKKIKRELYPAIPDTDGDLKVVPVIYHCKAVTLLKKVRAGSTGLILTDPPYISEFHDNYDEYLRFTESWLLSAAEKISETGWLMVFASSEPDEMRVYLDTFAKTDLILKTPFVWTYNNTIGPSGSENLIRNYQIGWLAGREGSTLRGDIKQKWASQTVNAPDGRLGNRYFEWQKPDELADTLVGVLSQDDSVVVDPFAGSGAFLLAAGRRGLKSFGCDSIEDQVSLCEQRGCARG